MGISGTYLLLAVVGPCAAVDVRKVVCPRGRRCKVVCRTCFVLFVSRGRRFYLKRRVDLSPKMVCAITDLPLQVVARAYYIQQSLEISLAIKCFLQRYTQSTAVLPYRTPFRFRQNQVTPCHLTQFSSSNVQTPFPATYLLYCCTAILLKCFFALTAVVYWHTLLIAKSLARGYSQRC